MLVIFDKKNRTGGVKDYLENGADGRRDEKDKRVSLYGDLNLLDKVTKYTKNTKKYKEIYRNIVLSFAEDELDTNILEQVAQDFIQSYMVGYNPDEFVAYAEAHLPKQKLNSRGEERKPHIHISISTYSPKLDHQLALSNHKNRLKEITKIKELIETKYNLKSLDYKKTIQPNRAEIFDITKYAKQTELKKAIEQYITNNIQKYNNFEDMISNIERITGATEIKISEKAKTPYISLKVQKFKRAIRLKGELFNKNSFNQAKKAILNNTNKVNITQTPKKDIEELKTELTKLQKNRIESIEKRVKKKREQQSNVFSSLSYPQGEVKIKKTINNNSANIVKSKLQEYFLKRYK
jgi:hypothetical protein